MKNVKLITFLFGILTTGAWAGTNEPQEFSVGVSASFGDAGSFYSSLSPYGEWLELESGFYGWRPLHVHAGWRPYLHGHWSWTHNGWYWLSSEPFGWAVFHYGRWYYDDYYGWIWIPDHTWGPAWVEWRYNDDYIGWAPLPPYASFSFSIGIRFTTHWFAPYRYWNFVRYRHMTSHYVDREIVPMEYTRRLMGMTRNTGRYEVNGDRVINSGVDRSIVERRGGYRRIEPVEIRESSTVGERLIRSRNQELIEVYRPGRTAQAPSAGRIEARKIERGTSLDLQRVERGPRDATRATTGTPTERERGTVREDARSPQERTQLPEAQGQRRETAQPRRIERQNEGTPAPSTERRDVERRREERFPFPAARQQTQRNQERRATTPEQPQRQQQKEISQPRTRIEQSRPAPSTRQESPRGSEQGRRESGRKRG